MLVFAIGVKEPFSRSEKCGIMVFRAKVPHPWHGFQGGGGATMAVDIVVAQSLPTVRVWRVFCF